MLACWLQCYFVVCFILFHFTAYGFFFLWCDPFSDINHFAWPELHHWDFTLPATQLGEIFSLFGVNGLSCVPLAFIVSLHLYYIHIYFYLTWAINVCWALHVYHGNVIAIVLCKFVQKRHLQYLYAMISNQSCIVCHKQLLYV